VTPKKYQPPVQQELFPENAPGFNTVNIPDRAEQVNKVLYSIANAVNTTPDLDVLYQAIHQSLGLILDVSNFFIAIVNSREKTLYFPYYADSRDTDFSPISNFDTSDSLTGLVVLHRKPLLLTEELLLERAENEGIWGPIPLIWMGVPLVIREEVIGIIAVQNYHDPAIYDEQDLKLLTAISDQVAIAIDRKRSLDELRESEKRYRQLFEQSNDAIFIHELQGKILDCNFRASEMLGYSRMEIMSMNLKDFQINDETELQAILEQLQAQGHVRFENILKTSNGSVLDVEISSRLIDPRSSGIVQGIIRDISKSKQAVRQLVKSEEKYSNLFHNALVGLFRTDKKKKALQECNDALAHMFGYEDRYHCMQKFDPQKAFIDAEGRFKFYELISRNGKIDGYEMPIRKRDGTIGVFRLSAAYYPEHNIIEGVAVDITEMKAANDEKIELQRKLSRSKKMEALGMLAGGVAHDLNNILAGIINYPELLLMKYPGNTDLQKPLEAILDSGKRGALIVADMLAIARSAAVTKETRNLNELVGQFQNSPEYRQLQSLYPELTITTRLEAEPSWIKCSPVHVNKCLVNLFSNAAEAIVGVGNIIWSTSNQQLKSFDNQGEQSETDQSDYVVLSIEDSGTGISDEEVERIFEPFYTRKVMGRSGTGLGLTVVWNTMQDHGGTVIVKNDTHGTCFELFFPAVTSMVPDEDKNNKPKLTRGNGESILVVDDEPSLRDISCQILSSLDYTPVAVSSGEEAIEYLRNNSADLVLLDMIMDPGINGLATYTRIIEIHPHQKAIIASGYSNITEVTEALQRGVGQYIKKPYSMEELSKAVASELGKQLDTALPSL